MEKLPIFKRSLVELLWDKVESNLELYEKGDLTSFLSNERLSKYKLIVEKVTYNPNAFQRLKTDASGTSDVYNAKVVYEAFKGMTPYLATDERVWVALTHLIAPKFSFGRYSKEDDKIKLVKSRFFTRENSTRGLYRDNALSSLWWYGHICKKMKCKKNQMCLMLF